MSLRIQTNIEAFDAHRNLVNTQNQISSAMEKLSSGFRINKAADDAAGLAISEKLQSQIGGLDQAQRNAQDAVSLVQTGEGALAEVQSMLQRVRDLAVQYNNGTLAASDKAAITVGGRPALRRDLRHRQPDLVQRHQPADRRCHDHVPGRGRGRADDRGQRDPAVRLRRRPTRSTRGSSRSPGARSACPSIDAAINNVSASRSTFGSVQNRLDHTMNNLATYEENLKASESGIKDVDMASEMVNFTKLQILNQAGTAMLAQANTLPQSVLTLLR